MVHPFAMVDDPPKFEPRQPEPEASGNQYRPAPLTASQRNSAAAISAGLQYVLEQRVFWQFSEGADPWVSACVLARLGELQQPCVSDSLRRLIEAAQASLAQAVTGAGALRSVVNDDAELAARIMIALRTGAHSVPDDLLQALGHCRQTDGGFALRPQDWSGSAPDITVIAIQGLRTIDRAAEEFLAARLQNSENMLSSWLGVCSGILDWDHGLAPLPLLNQACRFIVRARPVTAFEHALHLRCLVRLRLQQALISVAGLRAMQLEDGSWPGPAPRRPAAAQGSFNPDSRNLIPTVTAVSALALCESQPGLYFGSDLPRPRRLSES